MPKFNLPSRHAPSSKSVSDITFGKTYLQEDYIPDSVIYCEPLSRAAEEGEKTKTYTPIPFDDLFGHRFGLQDIKELLNDHRKNLQESFLVVRDIEARTKHGQLLAGGGGSGSDEE
jgi:hypothetical protein